MKMAQKSYHFSEVEAGNVNTAVLGIDFLWTTFSLRTPTVKNGIAAAIVFANYTSHCKVIQERK